MENCSIRCRSAKDRIVNAISLMFGLSAHTRRLFFVASQLSQHPTQTPLLFHKSIAMHTFAKTHQDIHQCLHLPHFHSLLLSHARTRTRTRTHAHAHFLSHSLPTLTLNQVPESKGRCTGQRPLSPDLDSPSCGMHKISSPDAPHPPFPRLSRPSPRPMFGPTQTGQNPHRTIPCVRVSSQIPAFGDIDLATFF